jgi:hypothetical protein
LQSIPLPDWLIDWVRLDLIIAFKWRTVGSDA